MARLGRAFPRRAIIVRSQAGKQASGTARTSGGGACVNVGKKKALSTSVTHGGGALVNVGLKSALSAALTTGGGRITSTGHKSASGSAATHGGGRVSTTGGVSTLGVSVVHGGGAITNAGFKTAFGAARTSGGGSTSETEAKSASGSATTTGGGSVVSTGHNSTRPNMGSGPDWSGFEQAQVRLRANFSREVEFFVPEPTVYADGVLLDPETGRPYDPTIRPIASGFNRTPLMCNIVDRPMGLSQSGVEDQVVAGTAVGAMLDYQKVAIVASGDVALASGATIARYLDVDYRVTDFRHDALGPVERYLAFLEVR